jgi:NADH-quinone oxidoreductase subunit L
LVQVPVGEFKPEIVDGAASAIIARILWLIPAIPMVAAGLIALLKQPMRKTSATLAIGGLSASFVLSLIAFSHVLAAGRAQVRREKSSTLTGSLWAQRILQLGWMLDPLAAIMLVMVTFVGLLIFIYSTGYMAHDENFTRFFCFLSLFAGGMLGVLIANSLLLALHVLGDCGTDFLSAHRLLVSQAQRSRSSEEGLPHHARRRYLSSCSASSGSLRRPAPRCSSTTRRGCDGTRRVDHFAKPARRLGTDRGNGAIGLLIFAGAAGKSGQLAIACLASRRDGRPDARLRTDPRRDNGCCRCLSRRTCLSADERRSVQVGTTTIADRDCVGRAH